MEKGVTIERALELSLPYTFTPDNETIPLTEAHGRILAVPLASKVDDPGFDNSAMDGWAVRAVDVSVDGGPTSLRIVGTSQAGGGVSLPTVGSGEACRIMTGAPIPEGADAIVMVEDSELEGECVSITGIARPHYIRRRGENFTTGEEILPPGSLLTPARLALAGAMGHGEVVVLSPPTIAIIGTGDELVVPGQPLSEGQLYESNTTALAGLVRALGCEPVIFPLITDSLSQLRETLDVAVSSCDAIITSGGVSMGQWDLVRKIMEEEGDMIFWRMRIRPGGPPLFGTWSGTPLFGLPGNPVSSQVVFLTLVAPWLSSACSHDSNFGPKLYDKVRVRLLSSVRCAKGKVALQRILITTEGDELVASTPSHQGSGNLLSMVAGNGLTLLPPDVDGEAGEVIDAFWFR
ncbi:MAG: molybdopterin molybdenumtransferase MoeA [Methanobacteriota archaeon]|nr:MAG: molybdopterin molybdenumtransferase MoeA [Euryarchaeota archaeon]